MVDAFLRRDAFQLVLSPALVAEIETALRRPKIRRYLLRPEEALRWLEDLVTLADLVRDTGEVAGVSRDPADEVVLAAAVEGRADLIVTGDEDLLVLASLTCATHQPVSCRSYTTVKRFIARASLFRGRARVDARWLGAFRDAALRLGEPAPRSDSVRIGRSPVISFGPICQPQ